MNIPREDLQDAQRWAEQAAADEEAELMYRRMCEDDADLDAAYYARLAAEDADAEAAYEDLDESEAMDTDIF